jgi:hypothetical protein
MIAVSHMVSAGAAWLDVDRLMRRGTVGVATPAWAILLPAVYLWRRARPFRDQFTGTGPFWLNIVLMPACIFGALFWGSFAVTFGN